MTIPEEDWLPISGIERFAFCRRQWALIHLENQWAENVYTTEGNFLHERSHDASFAEQRGDLLTLRALRVFSPTLGVTGICDVVEFHRSPEGVSLRGRDGTWDPFPIEYKHGSSGGRDSASLQLCCQAMCLEEMLCCRIPAGAVFLGDSRRRQTVPFTEELRGRVRETVSEMHDCYARGHTPMVKPSKSCNACAMRDLCLPRLSRNRSAQRYLSDRIKETES